MSDEKRPAKRQKILDTRTEYKCVWTRTDEDLGEMIWPGSNYQFPPELFKEDSHVYLAGSCAVWLLAIVSGHASSHIRPKDADLYIEHNHDVDYNTLCESMYMSCNTDICNGCIPHKMATDHTGYPSPKGHVCRHYTRASVQQYMTFKNVESVHTTAHGNRDDLNNNAGSQSEYRTDFVTLVEGVSIEDAVSHFDFSHLGVYFDGTSIFATDSAAESVASMSTIMVVRTDPTIEDASLANQAQRIRKIRRKGYNITNREEIKTIMHSHVRVRLDLFDLETAFDYFASTLHASMDWERDKGYWLNTANDILAAQSQRLMDDEISSLPYITAKAISVLIQQSVRTYQNDAGSHMHMPNVLCTVITEYVFHPNKDY